MAGPVGPGWSGWRSRPTNLRASFHTWLIAVLATQVSVVTDQVWLVDSTPVECGRSRETAKRSDVRGYAEYGYCASHTRYFLGFRLHLIATVHGIPIAWALTGAKADERAVLDAMLDRLPLDLARRIRDSLQRQALLGDKNYYGKVFETDLTELGIDLIRPHPRRRQRPHQPTPPRPDHSDLANTTASEHPSYGP